MRLPQFSADQTNRRPDAFFVVDGQLVMAKPAAWHHRVTVRPAIPGMTVIWTFWTSFCRMGVCCRFLHVAMYTSHYIRRGGTLRRHRVRNLIVCFRDLSHVRGSLRLFVLLGRLMQSKATDSIRLD